MRFSTRSFSAASLARPDALPDAARRQNALIAAMYEVRFGLLRRRDVPAGADREFVWSESVTHVSGINRYPCVRNGPRGIGSSGRIPNLQPSG
jgi:hypothetical protein